MHCKFKRAETPKNRQALRKGGGGQVVNKVSKNVNLELELNQIMDYDCN